MSERVTPISNPRPGHSHRWHVFQVKNAFEPIATDEQGLQYYEMNEYAYMVCVCGAVVKSQVQDNPNALEEALDNA